jgi:hypothetical protein
VQIIDRRLYTTADPQTGRATRTLVEDGDPRAAFLWANAGTEMDDQACGKFGYKPDEKKAAAAVARATRNDETTPQLAGGAELVAPLTDAEREAQEADVDAKSGGKPADKSQGKPADKNVGKPQDKGR